MRWEIVYIVGIILSFSPFYFNLGGLVFHYSLLGYGLILLSFYYKDKFNRFDALIVVSLIFSILCGILNYFQLYYFFIFAFYILSIFNIYYFSKNRVLKIVSHFFSVLGGVIILFLFFGINGQKFFLFFFYYLYGIYIILGLIIK